MGRQINVETAGRMRNMIHEPEFWLPSMEKNRKVEFKDGVFQSNVKIACPKRQENTDCLGNQPLGLRNLTVCFGKSPEGLLAARFFFLSRDPQPAPSQPQRPPLTRAPHPAGVRAGPTRADPDLPPASPGLGLSHLTESAGKMGRGGPGTASGHAGRG